MGDFAMKRLMYDLDEVTTMIREGKRLALAGEEELLNQLPKGQWIAGTIPYFMAEEGGVCNQTRIFVNELPSFVNEVKIVSYDGENIENVNKDAFENGFSIIIIPAFSFTHQQFAVNAPQYEGFATKPLIGWISGVRLDYLQTVKPKVFNGQNLQVIEDGAVVMHVSLPENKYADINIINIFEPGLGDVIRFEKDGFSVDTGIINGVKQNIAKYITENKIDIKLPLVADYCGAIINTSIQGVDIEKGEVHFYAPVFKQIEYKFASEVKDYITDFINQMPQDNLENIFFSCNCILNYIYSNLEGKKTGGMTGPITFGEIAYQLLNQTLVYISINEQ